MKQTTLTDIAKQAGVSVKSVHGVLNNKAGIRVSDKKRKQIEELAETLNYTPNHFARSLKTGRTNIIGVTSGLHVPIRQVFKDPYFSNLFAGIGDAAADNGYRLLFQQNDTTGPDTSLEMISSKMVDGVVFVLLSQHVEDFLENQLPRLRKLDVPFTVVTTFPGLPEVPSAGVDAGAGAYDCARHLLEHGYRDFGFLYFETGENRFNHALKTGFFTALKEYDIDPATVTMLPADRVYSDGGYRAVENSINTGMKFPRALFCTDLRMARGALKRLKEAGIAVPDTCAMAVYGIEPDDENLSSALTVSRAPVEETGAAAVRMLMEQIDGNTVKNRVQIPNMKIRKSCGCT